MSNSITGKIIVTLMIAIILIGAMPLQSAHAFNFQVGESEFDTSEEAEEEAAEELEPRALSMLTKKIVEFLKDGLLGLKQIFGLKTMDQMIFNAEEGKVFFSYDEYEEEGGRPMQTPYYMGIMPEAWHTAARSMHLVFQAIAWSLLGVSIVKNLLQVNLGTINPMMKLRFYDGIRDLFMAGFLLVASLLIVETLFVFNARLVDIFKTTHPTGGFGNIYADRGDLASFFVEAFYFFVEAYLNFVYIVRAISTAILMATAPLFVISITFEGKNMLFMKWFRELTSNIFIQSFHAFMFSFMLSIQLSASGFENMVIVFSIIPLSEFFRTLILGESRGAASTLGLSAVSAGIGAASAGANALEGNKRGHKGGDKGGDKKDSGYEGKEQDRESTTKQKFNPKKPIESTVGAKDKTTSEALNRLNTEPNLNNEGVKPGGNYETASTLKNKDGKTAGQVMGSMAKGAGRVATGAAMVTAGVSMAAITGDGRHASIAGKGVGHIGSGAKTVGGGMVDTVNGSRDAHRGGNEGGNILHAENLSNGNVAIHRDRNEVSNDGLVDVASEGKNGIHTFTYDDQNSNMSQTDKSRLMAMEKEFKKGNRKELSEKYGIEHVSRGGDGNLRVRANKVYTERMGIDSMYKTGNRYVEHKRPGQSAHTNIVPNLRIQPSASSGSSSTSDNS